MFTQLPYALREILADRPYTRNTTGLSGAGVLMFEDLVLKIAPDDQTSRREAQMMGWLQGKLPVPRVVHTAVKNGRAYLPFLISLLDK